jgi:hypothetical protein
VVAADTDAALANAAHLFAAFHFSSSTLAINDSAEWSNSPAVSLALSASSVAPGGVTGMRFSDDGSSWPASFEPYPASKAYTLPGGNGAKTVCAQFQDSEGNISDPVSASIKLDTTTLITLTMPKDGATFVTNQPVSAAWSVGRQSGVLGSGVLSGQRIRLRPAAPPPLLPSAPVSDPKSTDHPLQADLTCPGRFRSTSWAADDHLIWPEALS